MANEGKVIEGTRPMNSRRSVIAAAALLVFAPAASAQSVSAHDPQSVVSTLQDMGYRATLDTDSGGDPKVLSALNGINFSIYFYGCQDNAACRDLQFSSGFEVEATHQPMKSVKSVSAVSHRANVRSKS